MDTTISTTQARYQIRVYDPWTGARVALIDTWESLHLERTVNNFDNMILVLDGNDPKIRHFTLDAILEVRRRLGRPGSDWYTEAILLHRTPSDQVTETGRYLFTSYSRGLVDLLRRRSILYFANIAQTLKGGPADDVMKEIVNENVGPGASSALRRSNTYYTAPLRGLEVAPNQSLGPEWKGAMTWKNVLDILQDIATASGVDFDVLRTGPTTYTFATFWPQRGQDRTENTLFSLRYENMTDVTVTKSRTEEATVAIVLGQGTEASRNVVIRGPTAAASESPWNIIEATRDARNEPTLADMQSDGDQALEELKAQENFEFTPLQTNTRQYGAEYHLGDKIKAEFRSSIITKKITGVTIEVKEGKEDIRLDFSDNLTSVQNPTRAVINALIKRLRNLETLET